VAAVRALGSLLKGYSPVVTEVYAMPEPEPETGKGFKERVWNFGESPLGQLAVAIVLLAVGAFFSSQTLMVVAGLVALLAAYRAKLFEHSTLKYRIFSWVGVPAAIVLCLMLIWAAMRWAKAHETTGEGQTPTSVATGSMVTMTGDQFQALMATLSKGSQPPAAPSPQRPLNADLRYVFYGKEQLYYFYNNPSRKLASKPRISFALLDLTNPYSYPTSSGAAPTAQPFPIPTKVLSDDYVRAGESQGYTEILSGFMGHVKSADVIWGVATITCVECIKNRAYYIYWKVGVGGWYAETDPATLALPAPVMTPFSDAQIDDYADRTVPRNKRKVIKERFND
jgi:hypothetical protein